MALLPEILIGCVITSLARSASFTTQVRASFTSAISGGFFSKKFKAARALLLDEFGHPILRLRSGPFSVDSLVHAEQFLALDG